MTNKEFKEEVFSRAEKQIKKRKKTIKTICASALCVVLLVLLVPGMSFFLSSDSKGNMAGEDSLKGLDSSGKDYFENDNANKPPEDSSYANLEIFDYSLDECIAADFTQKRQIIEILDALRNEALQKGTSITASDLDNKASNGAYRLKITFSKVVFYIGESSVCSENKELNNGDYLKNLLKIIEK